MVSCGGTVSQIDLTNLSTNLADITKARVYYTNTTTFATTTQVGTDVNNPGATFSITGISHALSTTLPNYFWVVFDVDCLAPSAPGNKADAGATSITINAATYTFTPANPTGDRTIVAVPGDNVTSAMTAVVGTNAYTTVGASIEAGEPSPILAASQGSTNTGLFVHSNYCWSSAISNTVWFKFVATGSGNYLMRNPTVDGEIAVWELPNMTSGCGAAPNWTGAKLLNANEDNMVISGSVSQAVLRTRLTVGNTYYIQVDQFSTSTAADNLIIEDLAAAPYNTANNGLGAIHNPTGVDMKFGSYEVNGADGWTYYYSKSASAVLGDVANDKVLMAVRWGNTPNYYYGGTYLPGTEMVNHLKRDASNATAPSTTGVLTASDSIIVWSGRNNAAASSGDLKATAPYVPAAVPHWWMMNKFWNLVPRTQPTAAVGIRTFYSDADFNALQATVLLGGGVLPTHSSMQMVKFTKSPTTHYTNAEINPAGGQAAILASTASYPSWVNTDGVEPGADPINQAQFNITTFSGGGGGSTGDPLVVLATGLLTFSGQREGTVNKLRWTTSTEQNNLGFEVQRSTDGVTYTTIGFVNSLAAGGNSVQQINYTFVDNAPAGTKQYYRLRQVDLDTRSRLSSIVLIRGEKPTTLEIGGLFPNPANSLLNVIVDAPVKDKVTMMIVDATGKAVQQKIVNIETGSNTVQLDVSRLSAGTYLVKLICSSNCESAVGKFVKQ